MVNYLQGQEGFMCVLPISLVVRLMKPQYRGDIFLFSYRDPQKKNDMLCVCGARQRGGRESECHPAGQSPARSATAGVSLLGIIGHQQRPAVREISTSG